MSSMAATIRMPYPLAASIFCAPPTPGERVELNGKILVVTRAWHQPGTCYAGAKFAILISEQIPATATSEPAFPVHDEVSEVIQP